MKKILVLLIFIFQFFIASFAQIDIKKDSVKGPPLPCVTPSTQAYNFTATAASSSSINLSWLRGDGDNVIILVHEGSVVDADPVSGTVYSADNSAPFSGSEIGTGNFVVYLNTGTSTTVSGLNAGTTYYFSVYEMFNADNCFLIPGVTDNATTDAAAPTISNVTPNNFFADKGATITITGSNLGNLTTSATIAGVTGTVISNDGSTLVVDFPAELYINNTLTVSTGVGTDATSTVTVNKRNIIPVGGGTDPHATIQSALDGLSAWFGTSAFSTATAGYLAGTKYIDVYNGTYTEIVTPAINLGVTATENLIIQNHAGQTPVINAAGNANAVYIGDLDYVTVSGFTMYSASDAIIYSEGDNNTIIYNKVYGSVGGSGILLNTSTGTTVQNNLIYDNYNFGVRIIASNNVEFKNNTLANNAHESKAPPLPGIYDPAQFYVESGTGTSVENNIFYNLSGTNVFVIKTEPGVTVSSDYNTYYKNGNTFLAYYNGATYADLAAWSGSGAGASDLEKDPDFVDISGNDYHIQSTFGSYPYPTQWPPEAAASAWNNDAINSSALDAGNPADPFANEPASGSRINQGAYGNTAQASKSVACVYPTTQANNFSATPDITTMDINWTRGDGDNVIVLAHEGAAVDANPTDGTTYTANAAFGSGSEIGTGNFVVYIGTLTTETVTALTNNTTYHFAVYEFSDANKCYLVPALTGNATTLAASPVISNVTPNNFFADKGATLTITGSNLGNLTTSATIAGVTGTVISNDGSTLVVDFPAELYINNTLTVSTGVGTDATSTVTVNKRNIIPVGGGADPHATIQSALDGLSAWFGTSAFSTATAGYLAGTKYIDVYNGTYTEIVTPATNLGVTATENLIIQNHVGEAPIIDATGLNNGVYVGDLDYVTVSGFTIHSANDANIYTEGDFNVITYNQIYGSVAGSGVLLNNAATTSVSNCLIRENYNFGVRVISSNNAVIKNNTILNNGHSSKAPPLPGIYDAAELYIESGTGVDVSNNIIYANNAFVNFTLKTEPGVTVTSDYNTYFKNGNSFLVYYNGNVYADLTAWIGNGAGANDLETDPDFVNAANDWHIKSTAGSYAGGTWPPYAETGGAWVLDATTSPALDAGDPADPFVNEPQSGNLINQGAYGNTAQASKSVVVDIYWDGSVSTDWQLPANWTPEQVPGSGNNAIIPVGCPNYPIIDDGITTGVCFNLQIDAGGSLIIAPNGQMTVYGDIINNATAADFVIQSDATGDGSLIETTLAVQAQVQRFLPTAGSSEWHFFSSPITSAPIALFGVGTYDYDEIQDDWWTGPDYYFNVNSGWSDPPVNMLVANGYIWYGGQQTKTFQGDLNANVDYTIPLTYTVHPGLAANGNPYAIYDGWVLVGNPYPCALDWELIDITDDVTTTVYYYDDNIDNYAYYQVGGTSVNGGSQYIPSGQAFFIKTNDAVDGGSVVIPEYARTHNNQGFWKSKADKEVVRLKVSSGNYYDETLIQVSELASDDYMDNYDAFKHFSWNYLVPQIFTMNNDRTVNMSINSFNLDEFRKILPLGYKFAQAGEYEISITENTAKETFVIIKDIETENMTLVSEDDNYVITPSNNLTTDHLELILEKNLAPQIVDLLSDVQIDEFSGFKFVIPSDFYSDVNMFDQITVSASLPDGSELPAWIMFNSSDFSFSGNALGAQKIIVKMTVTDMFGYSAYTDFVVDVVGNPTIAQQVETNLLLYPSPTENFVYLQISGGQYDYDVQISTMNGAVVYEKNFTNKKTNVIDVSDFAAGVYMMTVIFDDNSTIVKKFIKK